ncbi:MAG: TlpA family protein disulfide reductase [Planctomycetota bacterium]
MTRTRCFLLLACAWIAAAPLAIGATLTSEEAAAGESQKSAGEIEFETLAAEYDAAREAFWQQHAGASADERVAAFHHRPAVRPYLLCFASLAECHAGTELAAACYAWIVAHDADGAARGAALSALMQNHTASLHWINVCPELARSLTRTSGDLLVEIASRTPWREVRGHAVFQRAKYLLLRARAADALKHADGEEFARLTMQHGAELVGELLAISIAALEAEAEKLLLRVRAEYEGIALARDRSLESAAESELFELKYLGIGKTAPEIFGLDLNGRDLRLSEFRGKIVVVDFWGSWCEPSRAMFDSKQALIERLAPAPFVYLGVNSDAEGRRIQLGTETPWRSWWNGGSPKGGIAADWNVTAWPTTYLLDHHGTIRYKNVRGEKLAAAIDTLLFEMDPKPRPEVDGAVRDSGFRPL